jgi:capsular polysaccharide transport system permease protein
MKTTEPHPPIIEEIELTPLQSQGELVVLDDVAADDAPRTFFSRYALALITIALPMVIAAIYLFLVASNRFVSEARFVVRSASPSGIGGLTAMIENEGLSRANDETYAVNAYIVSRDMVTLLVRNDRLREMLSRPEADFVNRFPNLFSRDNQEALFRRYKEMVSAQIDSATGISTLTIESFRSEDAEALATAILKYAEGLINRLNERAYDDAVRYSQNMVDRAQADVADIQARLTVFRNSSGSVDPGREAASSFELIGKMNMELSQLQAAAEEQAAISPSSPAIRPMREKINAYRAEIDKMRSKIVGNQASLASKLADFEKLMLERDFATRALTVATAALVKARQDAQQQHLYLQKIVEPNLADEAKYPRRFVDLLVVFLICLAGYSILSTLRLITLEHRA